MRKKISIFLLACLLICIAGCGNSNGLDPKNPVTLTVWHTYGEPMRMAMDELINEFNSTVGAQEGIIIKTALVADAILLNEKLLTAAREDPGSPELPDIAFIYPNIAIKLAEKDMLMDFASQFNKEELSSYISEFLEEGKLGGDTQYLLPIAKSTEVLYVNMTIFDRFAKDTGVTLSQLLTVEGIMDAAEKYYAWTDAKTPDIPNDGKAFFYPEELSHFAMTGFAQLGDNFVTEQELNLSSQAFEKIWDTYFPLAVRGSFSIFDKYNSYLMQTGEVVCATGTSAGAIFCPDSVTYPDNTKEDADIAILPYPVFDGGRKVALQRGGGICVLKSDSKKECAAGIFLKWLTEPEQNLRFTAGTGYMPVTEAAFGAYMEQRIEAVDNKNIQRVVETIVEMKKDYDFYVPPVFDGFDILQKSYEGDMRKAAENARLEYIGLLDRQSPAEAYEKVSRDAFTKFVAGR